MKVVLVNGPPRSGKDTFGQILRDLFPGPCLLAKFAGPLKQALMRVFPPLPRGDALETCKDVPSSVLRGRTPRQVLIALSEQFFKPTFGDGYFGQELVARLAQLERVYPVAIVTDSGFKAEAEEVVAWAGKDNVLLVRMRRPGHDFAHDSRGYLKLSPVETMDIENDGTLEDLRKKAVAAIGWLS